MISSPHTIIGKAFRSAPELPGMEVQLPEGWSVRRQANFRGLIMVSALESRDTSLRRGKSSLAPPLQPALVLSFDRPAFAGR